MARTPLYPRGGDFTTWALNITQRIERDYAELKQDETAIIDAMASLSAVVEVDIHSVSALLTADIASAVAGIRTDFESNDASLSAVLEANITSVAAQTALDLRSLSAVIKADIDSVSFAIKVDISSVAADIISGMYGGAVFPDDLRSLSVDLKTDLSSVSAVINTDLHSVSGLLQTAINTVSNTVSALAVHVDDISNTVSKMDVRLNTVSNVAGGFDGRIDALSHTASVMQININNVSDTVSKIAVSLTNAISNASSVSAALQASINAVSNTVSNVISNVASISAALQAAINTVSNTVSVMAVFIHGSLSSAEVLIHGSMSSAEVFVHGSLSSAEAYVRGSLSSLEALHSSLSTAEAFVHGSLSSAESFVRGSLSSAEVYLRTSISNTISIMQVNIDAVSNTVSKMDVRLNTVSNVAGGFDGRIDALSHTTSILALNITSVDSRITSQSALWTANLNTLSATISVMAANIVAISNTVSFLNTFVINPKAPAYGAKGDGATDDTAALRAALVAAKRNILYIPSGSYRLNGQLSLTGGVTILGAGMGLTELRWTNSCTSEGIYLFASPLPSTYGGAKEMHTVRDISLVTARPVSTSSGNALTFDYSNQRYTVSAAWVVTEDRNRMRFYAENVECAGADMMDSGTAYNTGWNCGIKSIAALNGTCHNVAVTGQALSGSQAVPNTIGINHVGNPERGTVSAAVNGHPVVFISDKCNINNCQIGIQHINCEGIFITNCNAVGCDYGYYVLSETKAHPQITMRGNHANCYYNGILIDGQQCLDISGNLLFAIDSAPANFACMQINNAAYGAIVGNTLATSPTPNQGYGIVVASTSSVVIADNVAFNLSVNFAHVINLDANTSNCRGSNNTAKAGTYSGKIVNDLGSGNQVNRLTKGGITAVTFASNSAVVTFPTAFENICYAVTANNGSPPLNTRIDVGTVSAAGFVAWSNAISATTMYVSWMALGQ